MQVFQRLEKHGPRVMALFGHLKGREALPALSGLLTYRIWLVVRGDGKT